MQEYWLNDYLKVKPCENYVEGMMSYNLESQREYASCCQHFIELSQRRGIFLFYYKTVDFSKGY